MNILIFSQHFWPENFRINDIAIKLSKKNNVYVVSSWPNYNFKSTRKIFKYGFENFKGLRIIRVPTLKRKKNEKYNIVLNYLSYILGSLFIKKYIENVKFDAVISYATSPIYQSIPAIIYSKLNKSKLFLWVQDLWPNVLKDLNIIKNIFILKILKISVEYLYKKSDVILAQSEKIRDIIKKSKKETILFYNPSNIKKFKRHKIDLKKNKKIIFAGNIGKAQGLENLVEIGKFIKQKKLLIHFEIIGEGSNKKYLQNLVKDSGLNKIIIFRNYMKTAQLEKHLLKAHGLLVSLGNGEALSVTIPAKFQTYIAYGKPIFTLGDNIVSNIVKKHKIGFTLNKNNFKRSINSFLKINTNRMNKITLTCENLYKKDYELNKSVSELEKLIFKMTKKNKL